LPKTSVKDEKVTKKSAVTEGGQPKAATVPPDPLFNNNEDQCCPGFS
jgi:hypothetical protein